MLLVVLEAWSLVFKTDHFKFALLIVYMFIQCRGSGDGLMVGVFDSGSSYLVSALAGDIALCSWARPILTVPVSTQVYKWVPVNLML